MRAFRLWRYPEPGKSKAWGMSKCARGNRSAGSHSFRCRELPMTVNAAVHERSRSRAPKLMQGNGAMSRWRCTALGLAGLFWVPVGASSEERPANPPPANSQAASPPVQDYVSSYLDPDQDEEPRDQRFGIAPPSIYIPTAVGNLSAGRGTYQSIPLDPNCPAPVVYRPALITPSYFCVPRRVYYDYGSSPWLRRHGYYDHDWCYGP
jgi:hypothetical protein